MSEKIHVVSSIQDLRETMARLRAPDGCPWDREQTHQTLCEPLIDETAELLDTIDRNDMEHMCEELGDVLLQVVFHSQLAEMSLAGSTRSWSAAIHTSSGMSIFKTPTRFCTSGNRLKHRKRRTVPRATASSSIFPRLSRPSCTQPTWPSRCARTDMPMMIFPTRKV